MRTRSSAELAHGVLPLEKFRFSIEQDILYLPRGGREEAGPSRGPASPPAP
jgi:hypothetical protein